MMVILLKNPLFTKIWDEEWDEENDYQAPLVRYRASVCEIIFSDFRKKTFSAESMVMSDPAAFPLRLSGPARIWLISNEQEAGGVPLWTYFHPINLTP